MFIIGIVFIACLLASILLITDVIDNNKDPEGTALISAIDVIFATGTTVITIVSGIALIIEMLS
jgi:hypothetical protein